MRAPVPLAALLLAAAAAAAQPPGNATMKRLAADRGCSVCHPAAPPGGDSVVPSAPSWHEIAARYRGRKDAEEYLAKIVITGSDPFSRHWKNDAAFTQMLPNAIEVTPDEARLLVRWILAGAK